MANLCGLPALIRTRLAGRLAEATPADSNDLDIVECGTFAIFGPLRSRPFPFIPIPRMVSDAYTGIAGEQFARPVNRNAKLHLRGQAFMRFSHSYLG